MESSGEVEDAEGNGDPEGGSETETAGADVESWGQQKAKTLRGLARGGANDGKCVKDYELRESSWFDRGTGHCRVVHDPGQDLGLLIVRGGGGPRGQGDRGRATWDRGIGCSGRAPQGRSAVQLPRRIDRHLCEAARYADRVGRNRQPSWTLPEGCELVWHFVKEVPKHFNNHPGDAESRIPFSSSPLSASPLMGIGSSHIRLADAESEAGGAPPTRGSPVFKRAEAGETSETVQNPFLTLFDTTCGSLSSRNLNHLPIMPSVSYLQSSRPGYDADYDDKSKPAVFGISSAVVIPAGARQVSLSGQVGELDADGKVIGDLAVQTADTFKNIEKALLAAVPEYGSAENAWKSVYELTSYHIPTVGEAYAANFENAAKYFGTHTRPVWTAVSVTNLAYENQLTEFHVRALAPPSA
ncbi:hypothetical protein P7C73_g1590, partial [Tremellales sp. Uapishka_1]